MPRKNWKPCRNHRSKPRQKWKNTFLDDRKNGNQVYSPIKSTRKVLTKDNPEIGYDRAKK